MGPNPVSMRIAIWNVDEAKLIVVFLSSTYYVQNRDLGNKLIKIQKSRLSSAKDIKQLHTVSFYNFSHVSCSHENGIVQLHNLTNASMLQSCITDCHLIVPPSRGIHTCSLLVSLKYCISNSLLSKLSAIIIITSSFLAISQGVHIFTPHLHKSYQSEA